MEVKEVTLLHCLKRIQDAQVRLEIGRSLDPLKEAKRSRIVSQTTFQGVRTCC